MTCVASTARTLWQHPSDLVDAEIAMRNKLNALEPELDETAQHLLAPLGATADALVIEDVGALAADPPERSPPGEPQTSQALDQTSEIELTAEQMDALLEGRWQP